MSDDGVSEAREVRRLQQAARPYGLTFKQYNFCGHYLQCGDATASAIAAGYRKTTAERQGQRILHHPAVASFLRDQFTKRLEEERMGSPEVLARLARLARIDPRKLFRQDGSYKLPHELDEATAYCLRSFETEIRFDEQGGPPTTVHKVKFADPLPALRTLAQVQRLLAADVGQLNVFIDLDARMDAAAKRVAAAKASEKVVSEQ